jgi:Bacterial lipid A biosynthesis acyltransferase
MSLSKHIQTTIIPKIKGLIPSTLKQMVLETGKEWFESNGDDVALIAQNLKQLNLESSHKLIENIKINILLHYYEKLLPLILTPQEFAYFIDTNIDLSSCISKIQEVKQSGRGMLLAIAHFGAVELIGPSMARNNIPLNVVLKFSTEQLSKSVHDQAEKLLKSGLFQPIKFIELGKPQTSGAMDMAAALRRSEALLAVFDEETPYNIPVTLFNKTFNGGSGLDKLIMYTQRNITVFTAFMVRNGNNRYKLVLNEIDSSGKMAVQRLYDSLEEILADHLEQWYFLHEKLPVIESVNS